MGLMHRGVIALWILLGVCVAITLALPIPTGYVLSYSATNQDTRQQYIRVLDVNRNLDVPLTQQRTSGNLSGWFPDGNSINYMVYQNHRYVLLSHDLQSGVQTEVLTTPESIYGFDWSPNGECAAYSVAGSLHINCFNNQDSFVLHRQEEIGLLDWSPDGKSIVYAGAQLQFRSIELFIVDVATQNVTPITGDSIAKFSPSFIPDGEHIVYSTFRSDIPRLVMVDVQTGVQQSLPTDGRGVHYPTVSPDGCCVAFVSGDTNKGGWNIYLLDIQTGTVRQLTNHHGDELSPAWMPN